MGKVVNSSTIIKNLLKIVGDRKDINFIFIVTALFYSLAWLVNPGNKIILGSVFILLIIFYLRIKNLRLCLFLTYLVSMIIFTGKTYTLQLVPAGVFTEELYPNGYIVFFVISPRHFLVFFMLTILVRDFIISKFRLVKFRKEDLTLISFYAWIILSDVFGSKKPEISLLFSLISLEGLILYFYLRAYNFGYSQFLKAVLWIFVGIVLFQAAISFQQFFAGSPIYKNLEHQVNILDIGWSADELQFRFRPLGTFPHSNILASWLTFLLSIIFVGLSKKPGYFLFASFIVGSVVLVMTISRSSWMGFLVSMMLIIYVLEKIKRIKLPKMITKHFVSLLVLAAALFLLFILPRAEKSLYSLEAEGGGLLRLAQTQETTALILQNPVFGVGSYMTIQETLRLSPRGIFSLAPMTIHNWYLLLTAEHGIPAVILFLIFVILSVNRLAAKILRGRMESLEAYLRLGSLGGILAILVSGLFQNFLVLNLILFSSALFGKVNDNKKLR